MSGNVWRKCIVGVTNCAKRRKILHTLVYFKVSQPTFDSHSPFTPKCSVRFRISKRSVISATDSLPRFSKPVFHSLSDCIQEASTLYPSFTLGHVSRRLLHHFIHLLLDICPRGSYIISFIHSWTFVQEAPASNHSFTLGHLPGGSYIISFNHSWIASRRLLHHLLH